jgi:alkylation response protein AidB-like acyl-CoA dehydrogenase
MDFCISDAQNRLAAEAQAFGETVLNQNLEARDARGSYDDAEWRAIWKDCADFGLFGLTVPRDMGGAGHDVVTAAAIMHGLGYGCRDNGLMLAINAQLWTVVMPILEFGTPEQKARYLGPILRGDWIGADAVTEAASGSDAMTVATVALKGDGGYVLNGEKTLVGQAPGCDFAIVFAATDPTAGPWGVSAFLVDASVPGFQPGPEVQKSGLRTIATGALRFSDCTVPEWARLGPEGAGSAIFARSGEWERQMIFCGQVGRMKRQLDDCIAFARSRKASGKPIEQNQSVANRLADMRLRYETAWLMQMRAAWQMDAGASDAMQAAITKLHISEAFLASSLDAVRTFGGQGFMFDTDMARDLRDAMGGVIYGGTSDIQRNIIAQYQSRAHLTPPSP